MEEKISQLKDWFESINIKNNNVLMSRIYQRILESYTIQFSIIAIFLFLLFIGLGMSAISNENSRAIMTTIAQSQAAIMAIIVSLTLVAVQLTSQQYSPRIVSIFLKKKDFWIFIGLYSVSIIYDILVLGTITNSNSLLVHIGIFLMIISLLVLFVYIKSTIKTLEPIKVIEMIIDDTKPHEIDDYVNNNIKLDNPLIVALDIINGAINRYEEYTVINGIDGINLIFLKTLKFASDKYECPLEVDVFDEPNNKKIELFEKIIVYFGEIMTDISSDSIKKGLKSATIKSIVSLEEMFNNIAEIENYNKNSAFHLIYNAYIIDDEIIRFLDAEGYNNRIADPEIIKMIMSTPRAIGNMTSKSIQKKIDVTVYTADYEIGMLEEIADISIKEGQEFRTFNDIYEKYEQDHQFTGPKRLLIVLRSLIEINEEIIGILPDLTDKEVLKEWNNLNYKIEISFLDKYSIVIDLLEKYGETAIKNNWRGITKDILDSLKSNLYFLILKGYYKVDKDREVIFKTIKIICSLMKLIGYDRNLTNSNDEILLLKEKLKILIKAKNKGWIFYIPILNEICLLAYSENKFTPIGVIKNLPKTIGDIGLFAIEKDFSESIKFFSDFIIEISKWCLNNTSWNYIIKTIISYLSLWGTKLVDMNKSEEAKKIMNILVDIENNYEKEGISDFVKDILDEIEDNKEFIGVVIERSAPFFDSGLMSSQYFPRLMEGDELKSFKEFRTILD